MQLPEAPEGLWTRALKISVPDNRVIQPCIFSCSALLLTNSRSYCICPWCRLHKVTHKLNQIFTVKISQCFISSFTLQDIFLISSRSKICRTWHQFVIFAITLLSSRQNNQNSDFNFFSNKSDMEQTRGNKWSQHYLPEGFIPRQKFHSLAAGKKKSSYKTAACLNETDCWPFVWFLDSIKAPLLFVILKRGIGGLPEHVGKKLFTFCKGAPSHHNCLMWYGSLERFCCRHLCWTCAGDTYNATAAI